MSRFESEDNAANGGFGQRQDASQSAGCKADESRGEGAYSWYVTESRLRITKQTGFSDAS